MKKVLFIINPKSGVDRVKALENLIDKHLDKTKFQPDVAFTAYARHGLELARNAVAQGYQLVVAVGGDGSVNDIIAGLYNSDVPLAIIPKGSGNGLARTLEIPLEAAKAIEVINKEQYTSIDLGVANQHIFVSNIGVGFDTLVAKKFAKSKRRGIAAYSWIVTKYLWRYKEWVWELEVDGKSHRSEAFILTVANARQFGYNFKIAPLADLQDGLFDIVIIKKYPKVFGALIAMRAFRGTLLKSRFVEFHRGKHVVIRHPSLRMLQVDGDVHPCTSEIDVSILPGAIKILVPATKQ